MYLPVRKSMRWKKYDYSSEGCYFVTIVTKDRELYFGKIRDGKMILSEIGEICNLEMNLIQKFRSCVIINEYIVMPNHIHCIVHVLHVGTSFCSSAI